MPLPNWRRLKRLACIFLVEDHREARSGERWPSMVRSPDC